MNHLLALAAALLTFPSAALAAEPDLFSDTWAATDALGRNVPLFPDVPAPRKDRTVGVFYFLWHGAHIQGGPYDVTQILRQDPRAMENPGSPLWGPLHAPHHWGQSIFGYYLTRDEAVLRKHAQMLADADVDVVVFDVTNQVTYREDYLTLLRVWSDLRRLGNRTPQVAFLTPFWAPAKVTRELWHDLYQPALYSELWFRWDGKPLLLADPDLLGLVEEHPAQNTPAELSPGHTLGQSFSTEAPLVSISARVPTWRSTNSSVVLTLWRGSSAREHKDAIISKRFDHVPDNAWLKLTPPSPQSPGQYYLEASDPAGPIGWWTHTEKQLSAGQAFANGQPVPGSRTLRLEFENDEAQRIRSFFTFRKPQPDYFRGPTQPNMWSWLEVYPQHGFTNSNGELEQMSVGVAQNAVHGRLGSMSEPGAQGRSFHRGANDPQPNAVRYGLNVTEQWERALQADPRFIFVTGWNEWIAGRFAEFAGVRHPVMFVDQFDQEHSRDIEPMQGGHGDDYYYQLVTYIRRFKGARPLPVISPTPIQIDGDFADWHSAQPEFRDTIGDPVQRDHRGWDPNVTYRNSTGRNDLVAAKFSFSQQRAFFYVRTREPITPPAGTNWMVLFIDLHPQSHDQWSTYDFVVNRAQPGSIERHGAPVSGGHVRFEIKANELELSIDWQALGLSSPPPLLDFKWADNCLQTGSWTDFTLNGDTAPNDRFNYRARLTR